MVRKQETGGKRMNQEFAENIKNHIREYLPVDYQDAKITLEKVTKGNDRILTGLIIRKDGHICGGRKNEPVIAV